MPQSPLPPRQENPFGDVPPEVQAARAPRGLVVNLFIGVLSDIAYVEIAIGAIETEAPRVPHSVRPNARVGADYAHKRV